VAIETQWGHILYCAGNACAFPRSNATILWDEIQRYGILDLFRRSA
jgi:hypothetical protein